MKKAWWIVIVGFMAILLILVLNKGVALSPYSTESINPNIPKIVVVDSTNMPVGTLVDWEGSESWWIWDFSNQRFARVANTGNSVYGGYNSVEQTSSIGNVNPYESYYESENCEGPHLTRGDETRYKLYTTGDDVNLTLHGWQYVEMEDMVKRNVRSGWNGTACGSWDRNWSTSIMREATPPRTYNGILRIKQIRA